MLVKHDLIKKIRTKLIVPHKDGKLTFLHPLFPSDGYANTQRRIINKDLIPPTMAETVSLVHAAFNTDDQYSKEIRDLLYGHLLAGRGFWGFTGNLYIPNEGVYIEDIAGVLKGDVIMNRNNLIARLESNDENVRFVPFGYKTGEQTSRELEKNPYIIGLTGVEGAEKLSEITSYFEQEKETVSDVRSYNSVDKPISNFSGVNISRGFFERINIFGNCSGPFRWGRAFGILRESKQKTQGSIE